MIYREVGDINCIYFHCLDTSNTKCRSLFFPENVIFLEFLNNLLLIYVALKHLRY